MVLRRFISVITCVCLLLFGDFAVQAASAAASGGGYVPLNPTTRVASAVSIGPGSYTAVQVTGVGGVPSSGVSAVDFVLTGTDASTSFLTTYTDGTYRPGTSNESLNPNQTTSNSVIVAPSSNGYVDIYNNAGTATIYVDVDGYYESSSRGVGFQPLAVDQRIANGVYLGAQQTTEIQVAGVDGIPSNISVLAAALTGANSSVGGNLRCFADGGSVPSTSSDNLTAGTNDTALTQCPVGADGKVDIYNAAGTVSVYLDAEGWYAPSSTGATVYTATPPQRVYQGSVTTSANSVVALNYGDIAATATTVAVDVTVAGCTQQGYVTDWPAGSDQPSQATAVINTQSNVGYNETDLVFAEVGNSGQINIQFSDGGGAYGSCQLDVDTIGYFGTTTAEPDGDSLVLGSLDWQTYNNYPVDSRASLSVDVADGNLLLTSDDLDIAGEQNPFDVTRYYNSLATTTGSLGYGTTFGMGPDVHVTANTDGSATLAGPSGYQVLFAPSNGAAGGYDTSSALTSASLASVSGGGWTLTDRTSGEVMTFNSAGNEISDAASSGEMITYTYTSGTSNLASVTDTEGRVTTFSNYTGNLVGQITDPSGRAIKYTYSGSQLTGVSDAAGDLWSYGYTNGQMTSITDPNRNQTAIAYNSVGQVSSVTLDAGTSAQGVWGYTYSPGYTYVTNPLGGTTTYEWDGAGRVQTTIDPLGNTTNATWNPQNELTSSSDPSGNVSHFGYSYNEPASAQLPTTSTGAAGATTTATYPSSTNQFLPASTTDAQGNTTTLTYDSFNNLTQSKSPSTLTSATYQGDGSTNCGAPQGEICTSVSPNGYTTSYAYAGGNLKKVTPPAPLGATSAASGNVCAH